MSDITPFDYSQLGGADWKFVQDAADTIHQLRGQAIILIGQQLAAVKARLPYGLYGDWLAKEFAWSKRTARNYVQVFETFGSSAKFAEVSRNIDRSAQYLLASESTPQAVRDEALAKAAAGERVTHQTVERRIHTTRTTNTPPIPAANSPDMNMRRQGWSPGALRIAAARLKAEEQMQRICTITAAMSPAEIAAALWDMLSRFDAMHVAKLLQERAAQEDQ